MLAGVAQGGPRHKVKLICPTRWDGRVHEPDGVKYYAGHYVWEGGTWVWYRCLIKSAHRHDFE